MKKKCRGDDKIKFDSFERAWQVAGKLLYIHKKDFYRAYRCKFCSKIHLTTK
jgi:hypothetical protein